MEVVGVRGVDCFLHPRPRNLGFGFVQLNQRFAGVDLPRVFLRRLDGFDRGEVERAGVDRRRFTAPGRRGEYREGCKQRAAERGDSGQTSPPRVLCVNCAPRSQGVN
jgi:hypothetical protein